MDKDKVVEAAKELVKMLELNEYRGTNTALLMKNTMEFRALKEALEPKPSREEVVEWLESISLTPVDVAINWHSSYKKYAKATIELLKQPTREWVKWGKGYQAPAHDTRVVLKYTDGTCDVRKTQDVVWSLVTAYMVIE